MITVRLQGGLGNQMFQYALGRTLAQRNRTSLALDITRYQHDTFREYSLGVFAVEAQFCNFPQLSSARSWGQRMRLPGFAFELGSLRVPGFTYVVKEKALAFDPSVLQAPDNVYLDGFWQTDKYFREAAEIVRQEFRLKSDPTGENAAMARQIQSMNAVSMHVRRTDYIANPDNIHFALSLDYYRRAVELAQSKASDLHFFIFSDDPEWCRASLDFVAPATFVAHNSQDQAHEDLRLMTLCRHHIIANSTFSWWGAWLGNSKGMVVTPQTWFQTTELNTRDLIPAEWIQL